MASSTRIWSHTALFSHSQGARMYCCRRPTETPSSQVHENSLKARKQMHVEPTSRSSGRKCTGLDPGTRIELTFVERERRQVSTRSTLICAHDPFFSCLITVALTSYLKWSVPLECPISFVSYSCNVRSQSLMSVDDPNSTLRRNMRFSSWRHHASLQLMSPLMA